MVKTNTVQEIDIQVIDFCNKHNILWFPILLQVENGKKQLMRIHHELYNHDYPKQTDFENISVEIILQRQSLLQDAKWSTLLKHIAMDTKTVFHIDIDTPDYEEGYNTICESTPYFKSTSKAYGKHILFVSPEFNPPKKRCQMKNVYKNEIGGIELLCGQWSWSPINNKVMNGEMPIIVLNNVEDLLLDYKVLTAATSASTTATATTTAIQEVTPSAISITTTKDAEDDLPFIKHVENIAIHYINDYTIWLKIIWSIRSFNENLRDVALALTKKSPKYIDDDYFQKVWDSYNPDTRTKVTERTIYFYSRLSNPEKYTQICQESFFIDAIDLNDPYKVATVICRTLRETLVLCREKWFMLDSKQLWQQQQEPSYYIINELRKYIDSSNQKTVKLISVTEGKEKEQLIENSKAYLKSYPNISKSGFLSVLTKYCKCLLVDNTFAEKLDNNHGKLAFKNGIMNLETLDFKTGIDWSDFLTETIPYNYVKSDSKNIKQVLKKILNNNEEHLEYFLSIIGYSFIGRPELEKSLYFMIDKTECGRGDNGKTLFFEIMTELLPCYVYKTKASLLETNNSKVHKQITMMKKKRLVWLDELPKEKSTNAELMKEIGDGLKLENEVMFGTSETINIQFKLFTLSNHVPQIDPNESAVYNRYKQISFNSHFDRTGSRKQENEEELKFIADTTLSHKIKTEYAHEVFNLIIDYAHQYYQRSLKLPPIPEQFNNDTIETQKENDKFGLWFQDYCVLGSSEKKIALKKIVEQSGMSEKAVREGMKRLGLKYKKDLCGLGKDNSNRFYKGGYEGADFIEEEEACLSFP